MKTKLKAAATKRKKTAIVVWRKTAIGAAPDAARHRCATLFIIPD
jgi:hypothetical protein